MKITCLTLLFGSVLASATFGADLISVYTFDETSGTTAADSIRGASGDATLNNGPEWTAGFIGGGISLDGADDWLSANNPIANGATALSFSGWVKADSRPVWSSIVKNWGGAQAGQYHFGLQAGDGDLSNFLFNTDGAVSNIRENSLFPLDQWIHVAFTYDGSTHKLFENGRKISEAGYSGALNWPVDQVTAGTGILGIGVKTDDAGSAPDPGNPGYWDGTFDEFGFWAGALSEAEVETIYNNGLQGMSIIPEPSSTMLVGLAAFSLFGFARRRYLGVSQS